MTEKTNKFLVPGSIIVGFLLIAGAIIYSKAGKTDKGQTPSPSPQNSPSANIPIEGAPTLGSQSAPVTIIEFSDFQCPYCGNFTLETFPQIKTTYIDTGKAKIVFKQFPLSFHQFAKPAATASLCANEQGKFWEYQEKIFANQSALSNDNLKKYAKDFSLDEQKFNDCFDSSKYDAIIEKDIKDGTDAGIKATPTFLINGEKIEGAYPFSEFQKVIDSKLK